MTNVNRQSPFQVSWLGAWALGLTRQRRGQLPAAMFRALVPFMALSRAIPSYNSSQFHRTVGVSLPWLSSRWLEVPSDPQREAGLPQKMGRPIPTPDPPVDIHFHSNIAISIALEWASHRREAATHGQVNLLTAASARRVTMNKQIWNLLPRLIQHTTTIRGSETVFSSHGSVKPRGNSEVEPEQTVYSMGEHMPYLLTLAKIWDAPGGSEPIRPENYDIATDSTAAAMPNLQRQPNLNQQPSLSVLALVADSIEQNVKREVVAAMNLQEEKWASALEQPREEHLPTATNVVTDDHGRKMMQKIRSLVEEERFRTGGLR